METKTKFDLFFMKPKLSELPLSFKLWSKFFKLFLAILFVDGDMNRPIETLSWKAFFPFWYNIDDKKIFPRNLESFSRI